MDLAIIAEYEPGFDPQVQTDAAIAHSATALKSDVHSEWVSTSNLRLGKLADFDALWFAPGSPYKDLSRTLDAIQFARENNIPTLGTCGGWHQRCTAC